MSVPEEKKTWELCLELVKIHGGLCFEYIPDNLKMVNGSKLCLMAMDYLNHEAIDYIPENCKNSELCEKIVEKICCRSLQYIPNEYKTKELCIKAIQNCHTNFFYIEDEQLDEDICLTFIKNNPQVKTLSKIPEKFKTEKICEESINVNPYNIKHIPQSITIFPKLLLMAVENIIYDDPFIITTIPERLLTYNICKKTLKINGILIGKIPKEHICYELCKIAVESNGASLAFIPKEFINEEICKIALSNFKIASKYIPTQFNYLL